MSLSFINFHMRDYQRDTQQLPLEGHGAYFLLLQHCWTHGRIPPDDISRAAICKVSVQRWRRQLAPLVNGYFDANGQNKRASAEITKAERAQLRQAMAGHKGGVEAARRRATRQATATATAEPRLNHGSSHGAAMVEPSKKEDITTNLSGAARARERDATDQNQQLKEEKSGSAVQQPAAKPAIPVTSELLETVQKKRWV